MVPTRTFRILPWCLLALVVAGCGAPGTTSTAPRTTRYEDLTKLFADWRAFQQPKLD